MTGTALGTFRTLYIPAQWADSTDVTFAGKMQAHATVVTNWYASASHGQCSVPITVAPMVKLAIPIAQSSMLPYQWPSITAQLPAFDFSSYQRLLLATAGGGGTGWNYGLWSWIPTAGGDNAAMTIVHELGHSFSLAHAGGLSSATPMVDGLLTFGFDSPPRFSVDETGDSCSEMGYQPTQATFSSPEQAPILGWINSTQWATWHGTDQTFTLTPMARGGGALYAICIPMAQWRSGSVVKYWVEFRQPEGVDANWCAGGMAGIQLRVKDAYTFGMHVLMNAHPGAYRQGSFQVGEAFTDGVIRVDVIGQGQIRLRMAEVVVVPPPPPPPQSNEWDTLIADLTAMATQLGA